MNSIDPLKARSFAVDVVRRLSEGGFQALWAGGCVRDQLRGETPKDYDVATTARPDEVREVFGHNRTIPVGAAFGVITVLGPSRAGQVEVATFRRDDHYSDGRHPDSVSFADEREDAMRRDFTINGLFFDPLSDRLIDHVGGRHDLQSGIIRAIGDARQRIAEDKLRMLRAIRFAVRFGFEIEPATWEAITDHPADIAIVSAERIAQELRQMLVLPARHRGAELLEQSGLLQVLVPELRIGLEPGISSQQWEQTLRILEKLETRYFPSALAALLRPIVARDATAEAAVNICRRWRMSNRECREVASCLEHESTLRQAGTLPWSTVQPVLVRPEIGALMDYVTAVSEVLDTDSVHLAYCRERLHWPAERLNPPPLLSGKELQQEGFRPGPYFRMLLQTIRDRQLDGTIATQDEALTLAYELARHHDTRD